MPIECKSVISYVPINAFSSTASIDDRQVITRRGTFWDNVAIGRFFSTLKTERLSKRHYFCYVACFRQHCHHCAPIPSISRTTGKTIPQAFDVAAISS